MSATVAICGGGTGGHVNPGLAVAAELRALDIPVTWIGVQGGLEERLVPAAGVDLHVLDYAPPGKGILGRLAHLLRLVPAAARATGTVRRLGVQVALGLGGYPSLPGMVAARLRGCRCLIHEQNVVAGLANRMLAPFMHRLLGTVPHTFTGRRARCTGIPARTPTVPPCGPPERARRSGPVRLVVIGGSQGARSLNTGVAPAVAVAGGAWDVTHACGPGNQAMTEAAYAAANVSARVVEYLDDVPDLMVAADLVVCRAGASTLAELANAGCPAVLVPYPHAGGHQEANAAVPVGHGAARRVADAALADPAVLGQVLAGLADRQALATLAAQAAAQAHQDAARAVALACQEELGHAA